MTLSKYKMLGQIDHILLRPTMYMGSDQSKTQNDWYISNGKIAEKEQTFVPGFMKIFDEIITNATDHAQRPEGKHLTRISVVASQVTGAIVVFDNGGIPVEIHPEYGLYVPEMIFGNLLSGSNYDDSEDRTGAGTNGLGAKLTNIFSTYFKIETSDGKNMLTMCYENNMKDKAVSPIIRPYSAGFTRISYIPDYARFGMTGLDDCAMDRIKRRCYEVAACNPKIEVSFNGDVVPVRNFKDFVTLFDTECVTQLSHRWNVGFAYSEDGFKQYSYVNSTATTEGGTHVDHVMEKVVEALRAYVEKKTKQKVRPSDIRSQFRVFIDANINNPRFNSQTKEFLVSPVASYGNRFELLDKTIKDLIKSPIMAKILAWAEGRRDDEDAKEASKEFEKAKAKAASAAHIEKYHPATIKDRTQCVLFLAEGDSALKPLKAAKKSNQGVFPLRGKPDNVFNQPIKALLKKKEFQSVLQIIGLDLSGKVDKEKLRYHSVAVSTDADLDGFHIRGLLIVAFWRFWPDLIEQGFLKFLRTPIIVATEGKTKHEFFTQPEYDAWALTAGKHTRNYYKGLGGWSTEEMQRFMNDPKYMVTIQPMTPDDVEKLSMAFDPDRADDRKDWLGFHI